MLVTGASTGIGNLTARALALAGHRVYASVRGVSGKNAAHARDLTEFAGARGLTLQAAELDVQSQESADRAVETVLGDAGRLDVVVHNAGHLVMGYAEAFTAQDLAHLFDINVYGTQRVNRAALPHLRERRSGVLVYVGSTTSVDLPPFLAPHVTSKAAFDALAACTAHEVGRFGIETCIVMPGAFTSGMQHFLNASRASDAGVTRAYAVLDPLVERYGEATMGLFTPGEQVSPVAVTGEIVRLLTLPPGEKPLRSVIDFTNSQVGEVNVVLLAEQRDFVTRMGYAELLRPAVERLPPV